MTDKGSDRKIEIMGTVMLFKQPLPGRNYLNQLTVI
jgi:hypothetical protein